MSKNNRILSKNVRNVVATSVITAAFAFTSVTGQAYADNHEQETGFLVNEDQVEEATEESFEYETSKDENGLEEVVEVGNEANMDADIEEKTPSLLPGDLLYFTKKAMENVRLALTFNDVKEAELLVAFAQERINEAAALLAQGKGDLANDVLQQAIEQQESALEAYEKSEEASEEEEITVVEEEALVISEETQEEKQVNSIQSDLEAKFSSNILALQAALAKVENPQAKESLQKNIVKAQEKLEKKINKRLAKLQEKERKAAEKQAELATGEKNEEENQEEAAEVNEDVTEEKAEILEETDKETVKFPKEVQQKANNKDKAKNDDRGNKENVSRERSEEKQREAIKKQKEAAKKAEENKKENGQKKNESKQEEAKKQREATGKGN